jgi:VanZ family protein
MKAWLRLWWPALLWAALISVLSTDSFSWEHTSRVVVPLLKWLFPWFTRREIIEAHTLIRKSAHFTEYFVFGLLLFRSFRGQNHGWRWKWAWCALLVAALYAALDEIHQAFVASRTASPYDSLLDSIGAACAVLALWLWFRWRGPGVAGAIDQTGEAASE